MAVKRYNGSSWDTVAGLGTPGAAGIVTGATAPSDTSVLWADTTVTTNNALIPAGGTTGQVLSKTSSSDYATTWSTPSSGGMTLLSTTTLSGTTTTISSINQTYNTLFVLMTGVNVAANKYIEILPNNASLGSYVESACNNTTVSTVAASASVIRPFSGNYNLKAASTTNGVALTIYNYASTTSIKPFDLSSSHENSSSLRCATLAKGAINTNTEITSLVISSDASTFNGGTVLVYGVK